MISTQNYGRSGTVPPTQITPSDQSPAGEGMRVGVNRPVKAANAAVEKLHNTGHKLKDGVTQS